MIRNLFVVAFRTLKRDKAYGILNILGLTIGITFSLFLIYYILDELSFDRYHQKADRIYRLAAYIQEPQNAMKWASTPFPLGPALKKDYPEVEQSVRFVGADRSLYKNGELKFYEDKAYNVDSNIFEVFTYSFIEGDPKTALIAPNSMVLTQTTARKYFGKDKSVLGKTLQNSHGDIFKITGVIKDPPKNSHILFNMLISVSSLPKNFADNWGSFGFYTYVLLYPHTNPVAFEKKLLPMYDKYFAAIFAKFNVKIRLGVLPIRDIHLYSDLAGEPEELGKISYIYTFGAVALFMLIIACINYMNLTTARSARRAKEIGIRKVTGSLQSQLVAQFLIESSLLAIISMVLSLVAVYFLLPAFNSLSGKFIAVGTLFQPVNLLILLALIAFVGLIAGSYPAFYLSKFNPITVLKGKLSKSSSNTSLRLGLVVLQFTISMIMLICTLVVYRQLQFMRNKDLGFNKDQVISIKVDDQGNMRSKIIALKNEIRKDPSVLSVSTAWTAPGGDGAGFNLFSVPTKEGYVDKGVDCYGIDEDYLKTLGMQIVQGRNFSFSTPGDTLKSILVNENMVKYYAWDQALGKRIKFPGDTTGRYLEVIGVVKDFHQKSLYNPITPLILFYRPQSNNLQVKIKPQNIQASLTQMEQSWKSILPGLPFQYSFLDQDFESQYAADQKRGKMFTVFSSITIFITCLGLLGLIAFTTEQRKKEISIRKIMGAGISNIVSLIARNFLILVVVSCVIAFPVAWYFMHNWLLLFPYKTNLPVTTFLFSAGVVLLITAITVGFHTIKAALANPSRSLRIE
jgi:putative ABC transport system permease protein